MKNIFLVWILCLSFFSCLAKNGPSAITWKPNGGRFGDDLLSCAKAMWLSYVFDIQLLYQPFSYSQELMIGEYEQLCTAESLLFFDKIVELVKFPFKLSKNSNTLYVSRWKSQVDIDWFDTEFIERLKKNIAPKNPIEKVIIPEGFVSIAVHVRNGGTFAADTLEEKERCPLRFVPEEFFIEQIQRIAVMFSGKQLYVHIFTDHPEPMKLMKKFQKIIDNPYISFGCRVEGNSHKLNVLEDFFSMMDFDCLIRPGSHFTRFVQRLGNNKMVIYPESVKEIAPGKKVIDTIKIKTRAHSQERWKTKTIVIA